MKRLRVNRSTSFGNIQVFNPPPAAAASAFQWNPRVNPTVISAHAPPPKAGEMERVGILTVSSTEMAPGNGQRSHFLDKCFFCKKGMGEDDERFMYGYGCSCLLLNCFYLCSTMVLIIVVIIVKKIFLGSLLL